jgi:PAS domain S-box-containing protein
MGKKLLRREKFCSGDGKIDSHSLTLSYKSSILRESQARLLAIGKALPDLVFVLDEDGRHLEVLTSQENLLYRSVEDIPGRLLHEIFSKPLADRFLEVVQLTIKTGNPQIIEYELPIAGVTHCFEARAAPMNLETDGKKCIVWIARDITDRKRAEELQNHNLYLQEEIKNASSFGEMVGASEKMKEVFRNEVGELPVQTQVKLLRILQEQEFERLGGSETLQVNVRVIAATNRDLEAAVKNGAFRADLFYRLNIFPMQVSPLRERREDIPLLAAYFVEQFSARMGKRIDRINLEALEKLKQWDWPGNVRELANIIERAVIICPGNVLRKEHINGLAHEAMMALEEFPSLEEMERRHILAALEKTGGTLAGPKGAAQLLNMHRSTLWARMRRLGIKNANA